MAETILRVRHRHGDQRKNEADLVLEVGTILPSFYQAGRPRGVIVTHITSGDPFRCTLSNGEVILIGKTNVIDVETRDS